MLHFLGRNASPQPMSAICVSGSQPFEQWYSTMKPMIFWTLIGIGMAVVVGLVTFSLYSSKAIHNGLCPPANPHCGDKPPLPPLPPLQ
jgi:hypothetical protein